MKKCNLHLKLTDAMREANMPQKKSGKQKLETNGL